jgi:hypothetical protein
MTANPYESPETSGAPPVRKVGCPTFSLLTLLAVVGIAGLLIALLLPAVRTSGEAGRRMACSNHLKQIALGLLEYQDVYGSLPPAYTVDANGKPLHSWRTLILPYVEQKVLYEQIDLTKPWNDPANKAAFETSLSRRSLYQCPAGDIPHGHTTYLAVVAPGGCFLPTQSRKLAEITDDTDRTLMVIEVPVARAVHWMSPVDATEELVLSAASADQPSHPGGTQSAFVSGRIMYLPARTTAEKLRALISIAGNDDKVAHAAD